MCELCCENFGLVEIDGFVRWVCDFWLIHDTNMKKLYQCLPPRLTLAAYLHGIYMNDDGSTIYQFYL